MPGTTFLRGYKTILSYGNAPTPSGVETWTPLAGIVDVKPAAIEAEDIEVSSMDSPIDSNSELPWKEFTAGWANGGEADIKIQFAKAQVQELYNLFRVDTAYQISFADGSNWQYGGYIKGLSNEVEREKLVQADIKIKVSGVPIFNPGS